MSVRTGQTLTKEFVTSHPTTQAATNADSLPTGVLYVNGTADAATVTVTNVTTGLYKAAVTLPTLAVRDLVDLVISATVNAIAGKAVIWSDTADLSLDANGRVDLGLIQGSTFLANAAVPVDLTQAIGDTQTPGTVGGALLGTEAQSVGAWVLDQPTKTLTLYRRDGVTVVRTFNLDSATIPLSRT